MKQPNNMRVVRTEYLPGAQFKEHHSLTPLWAEPADIIAAIAHYDVQSDRLLDMLLRCREAPARVLAHIGLFKNFADRPRFGLRDFAQLECSATSITFALMGRFWRPDFGLMLIHDGDSFMHRHAPGIAKLIMTFDVCANHNGSYRLSTETRVWCPDRRSLLLFTPYWLLIRACSGLIRRRLLKRIKHSVE